MSSLPVTESHGPLSSRYSTMFAIVLFVAVLIGGSLRMAPGVCGVYHDDAIYASTAQSLAAGSGYRLIGVPGMPRQTKYPILYPAILSFFWSRGWDREAAIFAGQLFTLLCGAASVSLGYLFLVRRTSTGPSLALVSGFLTATSPTFLYFSTATMAEAPFALMLVGSFWLFDSWAISRREPQESSGGRFGLPSAAVMEFLVGVAVGLPVLCRTCGVPLVPAALYVCWRRQLRWRWLLAGAVCTAAPWFLWSSLAVGGDAAADGIAYYTDYAGHWDGLNFFAMIRLVVTNLTGAALGTSILSCEGLGSLVIDTVAGSKFLPLLVVVGAISWTWQIMGLRRGWISSTFIVFYFGLILVWPWPPMRFLVPLQLFLTVGVLQTLAVGLSTIRKYSGSTSGLVPGFVACAVAAMLAANVGLLCWHEACVDRFGYPLPRHSDESVAWDSYESVFDWLRQHAQAGDCVTSGMDSMLHLHTGLTAARPFFYRPMALFYDKGTRAFLSTDELTERLIQLRPRYVVDVPMSGFAEYEPFRETLNAVTSVHPQWFRRVYCEDQGRFVIYELDRRFEPASDEAMATADLNSVKRLSTRRALPH